MKLLAIAICLTCIPILGQDRDKLISPREALLRSDQIDQIASAIQKHEPFRLPSPGPGVSATATGLRFEGSSLILTGVQIRLSGFLIAADEAVYVWDTHQLDLRGNVHLTQ